MKRRNSTGFSRIPSRLAHRARPIRQYWTDATLSRLLPPSPAIPGSGYLQLHPTATTMRRWRSFTPIRDTRASWRTNQRSLSDRRLPLPNGQPSTPLKPPTGGAADNGAYEDSLSFTRPAFPSPVVPGWNRNASAFPWASHPAVTHDARQGGNGPSDTGPDHVLVKPPPIGVTTHASDLTSHGCLQLFLVATTTNEWTVSHLHRKTTAAAPRGALVVLVAVVHDHRPGRRVGQHGGFERVQGSVAEQVVGVAARCRPPAGTARPSSCPAAGVLGADLAAGSRRSTPRTPG